MEKSQRRRYINKLERAAGALREDEAIALAEESLPLDEESFARGTASGRRAEDEGIWWA